MKQLLFLLLIGAGASTMTVDIIGDLGLTPSSAERAILNNLVGRQRHDPVNASETEDQSPVSAQLSEFTIPRARQLLAVASGDRKAAAASMYAYVRQYVESPDFLNAYQKARESAKPQSESGAMDPATLDAIKKGIKQSEGELVKMKANKQIPATYVKQMEDAIAQQKKMVAQNSDPTPNKTQWLKLYPENPNVLIKTRLQEYLRLVATVDFNAQLSGGTKGKFLNPAYEKQSLKWKAIYRAGKEVNAELTVSARKWLNEIK